MTHDEHLALIRYFKNRIELHEIKIRKHANTTDLAGYAAAQREDRAFLQDLVAGRIEGVRVE